MADIIHLLPDSVANQIAAGEVIARPASVVKELMENSIDAGATKIHVVIKDAGRTLVQVTDNGKGMSPTDARLAFERHATSKITSASDLFSLQTMGFRGEALPSIAAVAQVELRTRQATSDVGTLIEIDRTFKKQEAVSCPVGTTFMIKNLFFNVPARRKFLKSDITEFNHILEIFKRIVLTYPEISFSLSHGEKTIYQLNAGNLRQRINEFLGKKKSQHLLPIKIETSLVNISGYVGDAEAAGGNSFQYFFVNKRFMRHQNFANAVSVAYSRILRQDEKPLFFIYFDIDPSTIDINVDPQKTEVRFQNQKEIWSILNACVKEALGKFNVAPSIDFNTEGNLDFPTFTQTARPDFFDAAKRSNYNPFAISSPKISNSSAENWEQFYRSQETETFENQEVKENSLFEETETSTDENAFFYYKNKYIFTPVKSGLMMIDRERVQTQICYERYLQQMQSSHFASQKVMFAETIELDETELSTMLEVADELEKLGFDISHLGGQTFAVNGVPPELNPSEAEKTLKNLLLCVNEKGANLQRTRSEQLAFSLAKSANRNREGALSQQEMNALIAKLFACENHRYTPDGKPILVVLPDEKLDKNF